MSKKVRVGIIGCGAIAEHVHVPDYHACPQAELVLSVMR
jgi:predicted dehydrogenase